jgi:hypothetical protein
MRWLVHGATTTKAVDEALRRHEHTAQRPAEIELADQPAFDELIKTARTKQLEIITTDASLAEDVAEKGFPTGRCFVYLQLDGGDVEQDDAIDRLFARYKRLTPGRLYTVTGTRVKVRQLPTKF